MRSGSPWVELGRFHSYRQMNLLGTARLHRLRKNTKFGNRISLDNTGKSAPSTGSENVIITERIRKTHFPAACSVVPQSVGKHWVRENCFHCGADTLVRFLTLILKCNGSRALARKSSQVQSQSQRQRTKVSAPHRSC